MGALLVGVLRQHGPRLFQTLIDVTEVGQYDAVRQAGFDVVRPAQPMLLQQRSRLLAASALQ